MTVVVYNLNLVTREHLRAAIEKKIARYQRQLDIALVIQDVIKTFDRKTATKRIATELSKRLGAEWTVYWRAEHGMYHLSIWDKDRVPYAERMESLVSYDSEDKAVSLSRWVERNQCYLLNAGRLVRLRAALAENKVEQWADAARTISDAIQTLDESLTAYGCEYLQF